MEEEYKGKIKFYDDEIEVLFPVDFNIFKTKLAEMLDLTEDFLINVNLSYNDEKGDKNEIKNLDDYKFFIKNLKERNDLVILLVEIKDESNFNIKNMSNSIISYKEKNNSNSQELRSENINNNISMNENYQKNKNFNNINRNLYNNNINNNLYNNNQMNNLYNNNINNNLNNKNQMNNNINNNLYNNNQMNNLYRNNINNKYNENQINNLQEIPNNNPNIRNQIDNHLFQNNNQQISNFNCPFPCFFCGNSPILEVVYYCPNCKNVFCKRCELKEGPRHNHSYYQIKNNSQYNYLHLNEKIKLKNLISGFENKVQGVYNNVANFFIDDNNLNNDINNNRNNIQTENNKELYLIKAARNSYDLRNVSDLQLKEALRKTNGNIDNAIILLTENNNNLN